MRFPGGSQPRTSGKVVVGGLDLSITSTGAVFVRGKLSRGSEGTKVLDWCNPVTAPLEDGHDQNRYRHIVAQLMEWVDENEPDLVVIERYALRQVTEQTRLAELGGIVKWELTARQIPWYGYLANNTWKAEGPGYGRSSKTETLQCARSLWDQCPKVFDIADAFFIARWGFDHYLELFERG